MPLSTIKEENESEISTTAVTSKSDQYEEKTESIGSIPIDDETEEVLSASNISIRSETYVYDSNESINRCFKEAAVSSSSIFLNPMYFFGNVRDPGIEEAFTAVDPEPARDNGAVMYSNLCKEQGIWPISKICKSLNIETLNLKYYVLSDKQMKALCKTLEGNSNIKELILQENWLSPTSCEYLANVLELNGSLKVLNLKECRIGPEGVALLSESLSSSSIVELDLSQNSLGDEGLKTVSHALSQNANLIKLNLSHNEFTETCAVCLKEILTDSYSLQELDLSWNNLNTPKAMKLICKALTENKTINWLNLSWNGLSTKEGIIPLTKYLKQNTTLKFLDFSNNLLGELPLDILMKGIHASGSLEHVKIGNNLISPQQVFACAAPLGKPRENPLKILDMENMVGEKKFLNLAKRIRKQGKEVIYGNVLKNYQIYGPYLPKVLFGRCRYLGMKPKKKKKKKDFGHFVLSLPDQPIALIDFEAKLAAKKLNKLLDHDLVTAVENHYKNTQTKKIDCQQLINDYMLLYPDTQPEPPKKKKPKKSKKKKKKNSAKKVVIIAEPIETPAEKQDVFPGVPAADPMLNKTSSIKQTTEDSSLSRRKSAVEQIEEQMSFIRRRSSTILPEGLTLELSPSAESKSANDLDKKSSVRTRTSFSNVVLSQESDNKGTEENETNVKELLTEEIKKNSLTASGVFIEEGAENK